MRDLQIWRQADCRHNGLQGHAKGTSRPLVRQLPRTLALPRCRLRRRGRGFVVAYSDYHSMGILTALWHRRRLYESLPIVSDHAVDGNGG